MLDRSFTKSEIYAVAVLLAVLLLMGFFTYRQYYSHGISKDADLAKIETANSVGFKDSQGNKIDLRTYAGKPLVINAWATWSPFSKDELPTLNTFAKSYEGKITFLAINRKESLTTVEAYRKEISDTSNLIFIEDSADSFFSTVTGYAMPETIVYDKNGKIVDHIRGTFNPITLKVELDSLLK